MSLLPVGDRAESQLCQLSGVIKVNNNIYELSEKGKIWGNKVDGIVSQFLIGQLQSHQHLISHLNAGNDA